jgi:ribulose bisphosphate carboxylase small subunit
MRSKLLLCVVLCTAGSAFAKEPKPYQTGKVVQMVSVQCGTAEKESQSLAGEMLGTDSGTKKTQQLLCKEYVIETEHVIYHIRPKNEKHRELLPLGEQAQFRLQKDNMMLRMEGVDSKEREYIVVSMMPRTDSNTADATPTHANHLQ